MNNTPTIVNSSNLSSWFSISDADGISSWSGNTLTVKGVSGNERVKLTALVDMAISFDYTTTSFCKISLKGQYICDTDEDGSYSGTLLAGQSFHCYFSNTTVSQTCTYSNIACTKMEKKVCYVGVDDKARQIKKIYIGVSNVARNVKFGYVGVNNVARYFFPNGKPLIEYAEGDIVYLNENGTPTAFYVACHDYESKLNGTGRTLLARKECFSGMVWDTDYYNDNYDGCTLDTWMNGEYKATLDANVQTAIGSTTFYHRNPDNERLTLSRSVFIWSIVECGFGDSFSLPEGSELPIADLLVLSTAQWTRSPSPATNSTIRTILLKDNVLFGPTLTGKEVNPTKTTILTRPMFTLPSNTQFDESTHEFIG